MSDWSLISYELIDLIEHYSRRVVRMNEEKFNSLNKNMVLNQEQLRQAPVFNLEISNQKNQ